MINLAMICLQRNGDSASGVAKLADFGCSSLMDSTKTSTSTALGTMAYMSPECMRGRASFPSDLWSLGLTALHLATGETPWSHLRNGDGDRLNDTQLMFHISQAGNAHPVPGSLPLWAVRARWSGGVREQPVAISSVLGRRRRRKRSARRAKAATDLAETRRASHGCLLSM